MSRLAIGLDARAAVVDPHRGLGRVTAALAAALAERTDLRLTLFVPGNAHVPGSWYREGVSVVQLPHPRRGAFLFDGPAWRRALARHPVAVLHLPAWGVPPGIPVPVVATLHDVTPLRYPKSIPSRYVRHRAIQRLGTYRRAALVHAVSSATAADAVHALGIAPDRVRTAGWAVDRSVFSPHPEVPRRHVLFVGGTDPHKRVDLLCRAWSVPGAVDLPPLVIAGPACAAAVARAAARNLDRIRLAGAVDDARLAELYRGAVALLLPSLWEGFGLPVLEAMACGCVPVVTPRASLPEVAGDAALYVPAEAPPERWAEAVRSLLADPALRARLAARGLERASRRSWRDTAARLAAIYREAAGSR